MQVNPFLFDRPLERVEDLVGRDGDLGELMRLSRQRTYTLIEAPRRYGKTSVLKVLADQWREDGALAVRVDFSGLLTVEEAARRVHDAYDHADAHGRLTELLRELLRNVRPRVGPVEVGGLGSSQVDLAAQLHGLLEMPVSVAARTGKRSLVAFDEFQDVLAVPGLDGLLRSHVQHHGEQATYLFAGSEPSLLRELFGERSRPFYGQAHSVRLGRIAPTLLADAIADRFRATERNAGEGGQIVAEVGAGHPQRTMLLAWQLWEETAPSQTASASTAQLAIERVLSARRHELEGAERAMTNNERRVTVAVAHGLAPTGTRSQRATGLATGSAAQTAVRGLLERGELEERPGGGVTLVDPLLGLHLREHHPVSERPAPRKRG